MKVEICTGVKPKPERETGVNQERGLTAVYARPRSTMFVYTRSVERMAGWLRRPRTD